MLQLQHTYNFLFPTARKSCTDTGSISTHTLIHKKRHQFWCACIYTRTCRPSSAFHSLAYNAKTGVVPWVSCTLPQTSLVQICPLGRSATWSKLERTCQRHSSGVRSPIHTALWVLGSCANSQHPPLCESYGKGWNFAATLIRLRG